MHRILRAVAAGAAVAVAASGLLAVTAPAAGAQAAPDGRIAYVLGTGYGTNTTYDIHVMNADGTGDVNLTPDLTPGDGVDESQELTPVWSPDGTRIAFVSNRVTEGNPEGDYEIWAMDADGGNVTQITFATEPNEWVSYASYYPTWSPDGTQIAFNGYRQWSSSEIFVVPADGTGTEVKITDVSDWAEKWEPEWSPDGTKILFTWGFSEHYQDLHTINVDGTGEVNLTPGTDESSERQGTWSPDGSRIAFRTTRDCCGHYPNPNAEIYVMEYGTGALTRVTDDPAVDETPVWSPDASQILFTSLRGGLYDLYVVDAPPVAAPAGRLSTASVGTASVGTASVALAADGATPVTTTDADEQDPSWSAGGTVDTVAPRSTFTRPRDGQTYARADLTRAKGAATDDTGVTRVQVALRRNNADGTFSWWSGSGWARGRADRPVWRTATGTATWSYSLPALSRTTASAASYTIMSRAGDAAGNVESTLRAGRNQATFEIS